MTLQNKLESELASMVIPRLGPKFSEIVWGGPQPIPETCREPTLGTTIEARPILRSCRAQCKGELPDKGQVKVTFKYMASQENDFSLFQVSVTFNPGSQSSFVI